MSNLSRQGNRLYQPFFSPFLFVIASKETCSFNGSFAALLHFRTSLMIGLPLYVLLNMPQAVHLFVQSEASPWVTPYTLHFRIFLSLYHIVTMFSHSAQKSSFIVIVYAGFIKPLFCKFNYCHLHTSRSML